MRIYFSGIGGVGLGPLAEIALDAGYDVRGSDPVVGLMVRQLESRGVEISKDQSGEFLRRQHESAPIDWFVYTSALPADHSELVLARELGIRCGKRDELLAHIIAEKNLKLIAIAGTHGKTTTTGMMVWTLRNLGVPVSYSVGTTLSWGPSGAFDPKSEYFVYECDEFDRNFLHFHPYLALITAIEHDHPDTYPTSEEYFEAFSQFAAQSQQVITWHDQAKNITLPENSWVLSDDEVQDIKLAGAHNRRNATLVAKGIEWLEMQDKRVTMNGAAPTFDKISDFSKEGTNSSAGPALSGGEEKDGGAVSGSAQAILASFPGTNRRFEKLADNLYTDYGHTPTEIAATLQMARELAGHVVLAYQPHQNVRQHEIRDQYTDEIFADADEVYWLPTYLSREDPELAILLPEELTKHLDSSKIHLAEMNDDLWKTIAKARESGTLVLCMGAGTIDGWVRDELTE
ncbi:MAG TPA: Mur ligase domain-containing protein [Candidatus Saccharimonadaceae bacterium]|nr:Mur ligase domain-containing protein [Candidatus Saccharimonadaceae bacterium]